MNSLSPRVSRDVARQRLNRRPLHRRLANLFGTLRPLRTPEDARQASEFPPAAPRLPRLEVVWLPYYRVVIEMRDDEQSSRCNVLIDAHTGRSQLAQLSDSDWISQPVELGAEGRLTPQEAQAAAQDAMVRAIVARPGWGKRPRVHSVREWERIGYPVWVYYFSARGGRLDARLLDAMTGAAGGTALKGALLATLAQRQAMTSQAIHQAHSTD